MYIIRTGDSFFLLSTTAALLFVAAFLFNPQFAHAGIFQFNENDSQYLRALSVAAAVAAAQEVDVAEKINLDENYQPTDFGIENLGFLPNNPLYIFKSLRRGVTSVFTFDPAAQAELKLQFAAEKLLEAKELAERGGISEDTIVRALLNYELELAKVDKEVREASGLSDEKREELANSVLDIVTKYHKVLGTFDGSLSSEAFDTIQDARGATAQTFGAVFALGDSDTISEQLVSVLDEQSGSEFKHFKNAEVLKEIAERVPLEAKSAIQNAGDNVLSKLQVQLEQADESQKATFADFVKDVGGSEVRHLEVINELEVRPVSDEVRDMVAGIKEEVLEKNEEGVSTFTPEQKEKFLSHLIGGTLENVRVLKEIENNVSEGVFAGLERVRAQATEGLKQKFEEAGTNEAQKQEFNASIERFHDAKSLSVLEEMSALIPDDKKEFFNLLKQKAAEEIRRDIENARNASQREVIYKSLAGDHPEDIAALNSFGNDAGIAASMRGVLDGLRAAQYGRVEERVKNTTDANRLQQFEGEYQKYQTFFEDAPRSFDFSTIFSDRREVFESPDRALQNIDAAQAALTRLEGVIAKLPFDVGFEDGHFDPAIQEIERTRATAERKLSVARTSLEYRDIGRAYGEAQAALQIAENGLRMAEGYREGRREEKKAPNFLPDDYYAPAEEDGGSVARGFTIYNASEFSQLCSFTGGFLKSKVRCEFADGRSLEVPGGAFPFRVPAEFVPKMSERIQPQDGKQTPTGCPQLPATFSNFCVGGRILNQYDARGCQMTPRCEYERQIGGTQCRGYISESSCSSSGCVWYRDVQGGYCDDEAHGRVALPTDQIDMGYRLHPTDQTFCGGKEGYQCSAGYRCDLSASAGVGGYSKCVKGDAQITCQAYFTGWTYESSGGVGGQCVQKNASGCSNPFVYTTKEQCERGQTTDVRREGSSSWTQHPWKFSDGSESSSILDRTDAEYLDFIKSVEAQCMKIPKAKFAWKPGAGNDSATNWQNFGIPDCSGNADAAKCGNNMCEMGETTQSCPTDCGYTGGDTCGGYSTETSCKAVSGCSWTAVSGGSVYGGYCALTSTNWTPQCSDSKDNDGDGKVDYPADSGCYDKMDDMESDNVGGASGMQKCFYTNATKNSAYVGHTVWCESDYVNCRVGSSSGAAFSTSGVSLGAPSQCESGWSGGCGMYTSQSSCTGMSGCRWESNACMPVTTSSTSCPSGQWWNGSSCVTSTTGGSGDYGSCANYATQSSCTAGGANCKWYTSTGSGGTSYCYYQSTTSSTTSCPSGQWWNGTSCQTSTTTGGYEGPAGSSLCPSGQYWSGSACVTSSTTDYSSQQSSCASAGGTWDSGSNYCAMPSTTSGSSSCSSGQYWDGSSCVSSSTTSCSSGQYWNGSSCVTTSTTDCPSGQYWNGSSCVSSSTTDYSSMQSSCSSAGGTWDSGSNYCVMPSTTSSSSSCSSGQYWDGSACVPS